VHHNRVVRANNATFPQLNIQRIRRPRFRIVDSGKENLAILIIQLLRGTHHLTLVAGNV